MGFRAGKLLMMFDYPCQEFEYRKTSATASADFEQLYLENLSNVYRLAFGLAGNTNDAEEITQESFSRAFQHFNDFRGDSSFYTWIYRITLNVAQDYLKQRKKMPLQALTEDFGYSIDEVLDGNALHDPEAQILHKEARYMCLHCMTECLPAEQRKIFCLAITLGLPQRMVAEIMECSLSKVKTTLHRARQRWYGYMDNRCSYIKKSNPCNCAQWVKFGLKQGWITKKQIEFNPRLDASLKALTEIRNLKALREVYMTLYPETMSAALCDRIKNGIKNKEWPTFL
jgi:RNA polymerase sigma-70 factor (ECF subfamily)